MFRVAVIVLLLVIICLQLRQIDVATKSLDQGTMTLDIVNRSASVGNLTALRIAENLRTRCEAAEAAGSEMTPACARQVNMSAPAALEPTRSFWSRLISDLEISYLTDNGKGASQATASPRPR